MNALSETAQNLYTFLSEGISAARKKYPNQSNFSFSRDDIIQHLHSHSLERHDKTAYDYWQGYSAVELRECFEELVNAGIFLLGVDRRYRLAEPQDIVKQRLNRGSYTGDTDNVS